MAKYRFKTEEEFKEEGLWDYGYNVPTKWNKEKGMNVFLGEDVPKEKEGWCDEGEGFSFGSWTFRSNNYKLKESPHKFQPMEEKLMEVSQTGDMWVKRVVFGKKGVRNIGWVYYAWARVEELEKSKDVRSSVDWAYAREIKEQKTKEQILEEYGLDLNKVEIID